MAFNKFDPHREDDGDVLAATTKSGERRARVLRWGWMISQAMVVLGFVFMAYWAVGGPFWMYAALGVVFIVSVWLGARLAPRLAR